MAKEFYHLAFGKKNLPGKVPEYCLLSGDPTRAEQIAKKHLSSSKLLADHRGLKFYWGKTPGGTSVISATSGMGAPSMSIIVNELIQLGVRKIIRIGTSGSIQSHISVGELVIPFACLCRQGAAEDIAPTDYPAAADPLLTMQLVSAAMKLKLKTHLGVGASVDTFYEGQERKESANPNLLRRLDSQTEEWRKLNVLNYEMEAGTLFKMGLVYGFSAACILAIVAARTKSEKVQTALLKNGVQNAIKVAIQSIDEAA